MEYLEKLCFQKDLLLSTTLSATLVVMCGLDSLVEMDNMGIFQLGKVLVVSVQALGVNLSKYPLYIMVDIDLRLKITYNQKRNFCYK